VSARPRVGCRLGCLSFSIPLFALGALLVLVLILG
jgi:hypothetical protein